MWRMLLARPTIVLHLLRAACDGRMLSTRSTAALGDGEVGSGGRRHGECLVGGRGVGVDGMRMGVRETRVRWMRTCLLACCLDTLFSWADLTGTAEYG